LDLRRSAEEPEYLELQDARGIRMRGNSSMPTVLIDHKALVRKQFAAQARKYEATVRFRHAEKAQPMIELAKPTLGDSVLDVASGWGFVALAFAPRVRSVRGVDLTPEMVGLAKELAKRRGHSNVEYEIGDAEDLPFEANTFDLVTCRAAIDHLDHPEKALREMRRVLTPSGRIVLYEFVAPPDPQKAAHYNKIERLRDPSHVRSLAMEEYQNLIVTGGLEEQGKVINLLRREFEPWMSYADASEETRKEVRANLLDSIQGDRTGLGPRVQGGVLWFTHTCVAWLLVVRK